MPKSYEPRWVTITLEDTGHLTIVSKDEQITILDTQLSEIQKLYTIYGGITLRVNNKNYTYRFTKPLNYWKSSFLGGWYNWTAPYINNPLAGVQKQWLEVFKRHGITPYKVKYGASILIGIAIPLVVVGLFLTGVYIFIIRK